jgi:hypothetical protein
MKTRFLIVLAFLLSGFLAVTTNAQTINGTVSGVVTDQNDAAIPGATVTVTNVDTGATRDDETNEDGLYRISGLPVGVYSVKVVKTGFGTPEERTNVSPGTETSVNFKLGAGPVTARVDVADSGALLEATQSQVAKVVDQQRILELPGRNSLNGLALLNPGVLPNQNGRPGSGFAVNGNRTRSNNFTIDGANNNDQSLSIPRQNLPPEAIGEFQIITNTFAAEYGRNAGSYVNQLTRSGTNEFHGTGFYNWQGNGVDALTTNQQRCFNSERAAAVNVGKSDKEVLRGCRSVINDTIYGFTAGGPVVRNHTFFFTSFDWQDVRSSVSSSTRPALSAADRAFLQANTALFAPGAVNFLLNNFPVANQSTSQGSLTVRNLDAPGTPVLRTLNLQTFNRGATGGIPSPEDFDRQLIKINTKFNDNDQFSFRFLRDNYIGPFAFSGVTSLVGQEIGQTTYNRSFTFNDVYVLTAKLINEARFTYSQRNLSFPENLGFTFGITGTTGFNLGNVNMPQFRNDKVLEITDNVAYTTGNHALKFGYNMLRYNLNSFFAPNLRGSVSYGDINNFLFDRLASFSQYAGDGLTAAITYENSWFAQDDWRINPDLTLNLGLRYEYVTTPFGFFSGAKPDINNFGPRLGLAWNPKGFLDGKFVFRAGFGVAYDQIFQNILLNNSRNYPRGVNVAFTNITGARPYNTLPAPPTPEAFTGDPNLLPVRLFSPNERVRQPMSQKWTIGFQYQLGNDYVAKAEYIGTKGSNLVREVEVNYGFTAASGLGTGARLDPTKGSILVSQGQANSIYHSMQLTLEKRFSAMKLFGINWGSSTFNANYTWSSFISQSDDILGGQANRTLPSDPRCPLTCDRGRSGFDQPHRFVMSGVWISPEVMRGNAILNRVFSGWELSSITTLADGTPYTVFNANNALGILAGQVSTVEGSQRLSVNPAGQYPLVSTPTSPNPNAYFIVHAANSGITGNLGANSERTGGTIRTDLAVVKNIRTVGETQRLQFRVEIFNLFNRRNFTTIPTNTTGNTVNTDLFLNLGRTNVAGRGFLFGARYFF